VFLFFVKLFISIATLSPFGELSSGFVPSLSSASSSNSSSLSSSAAAAAVPEDVAMRGFFDASRLMFLRRGLCAAARQQLEENARQRGRQVRDILAQIDFSWEKKQSAIVELILSSKNICEETFQNLNLAVHSGLIHSLFFELSIVFFRNMWLSLFRFSSVAGKQVCVPSRRF
jgi:hypothetical protein